MVNILVWSIMLAAASTASALPFDAEFIPTSADIPTDAEIFPTQGFRVFGFFDPYSFINTLKRSFTSIPDGFPFSAFGRPSFAGPILPQSFFNVFRKPFPNLPRVPLEVSPSFNEHFLGEGPNLADLPDQYNDTTEKYIVIDGVNYVIRRTIFKDHGISSIQTQVLPVPPEENPNSFTTSSVGIESDTNPEEDVQQPFGISPENPANPEANIIQDTY